MANWDQPGTFWDHAYWDGFDPTSTTPKQKKKRMKRQDYYPSRIGDQVVWLQNFKTKLPLHATDLGLVPATVTARLLDVDNALYGLDSYRGALGPASTSCYQCIDDALYGATVPGQTMWMGFTVPAGAPAAVPNGTLVRVFDFIADAIKAAPAYSTMVGEDLGIVGAEEQPPSPTVTPEFDLRPTGGGKLEVVWTKRPFDGVKLEFDLGTAGLKADIDLRPNYTLQWLPAAGQSAIVKVRLRYIYEGEDFGNWSDWKTYTLGGT